MAPPVTPSPRRFILKPRGKERVAGSSAVKRNLPSSNLHPLFSASPFSTPLPSVKSSHDTITPEVSESRPHGQFAPAPKFVSRHDEHTEALVEPANTSRQPVFGALVTERSFDTIEDLSQNETAVIAEPVLPPNPASDDDMLFDAYQERDVEVTPPSPASKRPRYSPQDTKQSTLVHPTSPPSGMSKPAHRFLPIAQNPHLELKTPEPSHSSHRPSFIVPPQATQANEADPLPLQFSPHRRSQNFVPGGLAATMRAEIMNLPSTISHQTSHRSLDGWKLQILESSSHHNMTLVQGVLENGVEYCFILVGYRPATHPGDVILVKGISWDVEINSHKWTVCVDWKVESSSI